MLTPDQLFPLLLADVWDALPPIKRRARITAVRLAPELGAVHGQWSPDTQTLALNPSLLTPPLRMLDLHGNDPPREEPWVSRALHTLMHECFHAIGTATGLDQHPEYLALSGWQEAEDDPPATGRYWERRPGWEQGPSPWRYRNNGQNWFVREYSTKSPYEAFADSCTHITLGWDDFCAPNAQAELRWLRQHVFGGSSAPSLSGAAHRWHQQVAGLAFDAAARKKRRLTEEEALAAMRLAVARVLRRARQQWQRAAETHEPWPSIAALAMALVTAVQPTLRTWGVQTSGTLAWTAALVQQLSDVVHAANTLAETTGHRLVTQVTPVLGQGAEAVTRALDTVLQQALRVRSPLFVQSTLARFQAGIRRQVALMTGKQYGIWRTTSGNPCSHCLALEGQRFPIEAAIAEQGDTLVDAEGKSYTLSYGDLWHPPMHPNCRCVIEYA